MEFHMIPYCYTHLIHCYLPKLRPSVPCLKWVKSCRILNLKPWTSEDMIVFRRWSIVCFNIYHKYVWICMRSTLKNSFTRSHIWSNKYCNVYDCTVRSTLYVAAFWSLDISWHATWQRIQCPPSIKTKLDLRPGTGIVTSQAPNYNRHHGFSERSWSFHGRKKGYPSLCVMVINQFSVHEKLS